MRNLYTSHCLQKFSKYEKQQKYTDWDPEKQDNINNTLQENITLFLIRCHFNRVKMAHVWM